MSETVAIVGSRGWSDHEMIRSYVYSLDEDDIVISGGAPGVDSLAELYARERGLTMLVYRADWDQHGRRAGFIRNQLLVEMATRVVAFWDGVSNGTRHTISLAREANKPVLILQGT